jgi:hypothetical protein
MSTTNSFAILAPVPEIHLISGQETIAQLRQVFILSIQGRGFQLPPYQPRLFGKFLPLSLLIESAV